MGKSAVGSRGRPRAGRRPARGRPPNGSRPEACLEKVGWYGRPEAGLWKADFCKFALKISIFVGKLEIWKLCFFMRMDLSSLAWEKHKKNTPDPHPPIKFCGALSKCRATFFLSPHHCTGGGGIFYVFLMRGGKKSAAILCFCEMHFSRKNVLQNIFVSFFVKIYVFEKPWFFFIKSAWKTFFVVFESPKMETFFCDYLNSGQQK